MAGSPVALAAEVWVETHVGSGKRDFVRERGTNVVAGRSAMALVPSTASREVKDENPATAPHENQRCGRPSQW